MTVRNLIEMEQLARSNGIEVILTSVLPSDKIYWNLSIENVSDKVESLNMRIKEYADSQKILYVDYYSHLVDEKRALNSKYAVDDIHPNRDGYRIMEPLIKEAIDSLKNK